MARKFHGLKITTGKYGETETHAYSETREEAVNILQAVVRFIDDNDLIDEFEEACEKHFREKEAFKDPDKFEFVIKQSDVPPETLRELVKKANNVPEKIKEMILKKIDEEEEKPHEYMA